MARRYMICPIIGTGQGGPQNSFRAAVSDVPGTGWQLLTLVEGVADEVVPNAAANDKFTVVRVTAAGTVSAIAKGNLTVKS